jgi:N-acetylmuramoyl-L-alanine amidase
MTLQAGAARTIKAALFAAALLGAQAQAKPLILLDPGHGGSDKGAQAAGFRESEFSLDLALRLKAQLLAKGLDVQLTRDSDVDLSPSARVALADAMRPAAVVSLHANAAFQPGARGPRVFVPAAGPVDEPAAPLWEQAARQQAGASKSLGLSVARGLGFAGPKAVQSLKLALFRGLAVPACSVECEFVTQPEGLAALKDPARRDDLAKKLAAGIAAWALPEAAHAP